ncbi:MAG: ABC transporter transmembrane domain-containing protein, partial [Janthinobacterium lividum]
MAITTTKDAAPPSRKLSKLGILWRFVKVYPGHLAMALIALAVAAGSTLAVPKGLQLVVDKGFHAGADPAVIAPYFWALLAVVAVQGIATSVRFYYVSWIGERVVADLRRTVQRHLLSLDPGFFEENRPSEIASRLTSDTAVIEQVVSTSASVALRNAFMGIGGLIYMIALSPKLSGLMLLVIPMVILPIIILGRRVRDLSRSSQDRIASIGTIIAEVLGAIKVVQAFTQEVREAARFGDAVEATFDAAKRRIKVRAAMTGIVIFLIFGAITLVLWEGAADVVAGRMTGGTITAFLFTAAIVAGAFGALTETYGDFMRAAGASGRIGELLAATPDIRAPLHPVALP